MSFTIEFQPTGQRLVAEETLTAPGCRPPGWIAAAIGLRRRGHLRQVPGSLRGGAAQPAHPCR